MFCLVCSAKIKSQLVLENMPDGAQHFAETALQGKNCSTSMELCECPECGTVQHFGPLVANYKSAVRSTKFSGAMQEFRKQQFVGIKELLNRQAPSVFELGAGEGEYLDIFKSLGFKTYGVEYSKNATQSAKERGHKVETGYFSDKKYQHYFQKHCFDAVTSFNFIEHMPKPREALSILCKMLKPDGIALLEVPNFDIINQLSLFNEFIPDHVSYFTESTFQKLLSISGFEVNAVNTYWNDYIISVIARRRKRISWDNFSKKRVELRHQIIEFFGSSSSEKNAIWSAGHQSLATISNLEIAYLIGCIIDSSTTKQGSFSPGSGLPILPPSALEGNKIDRVLVAAGGFNREIVETIKDSYSSKLKLATLDEGSLKYVRH